MCIYIYIYFLDTLRMCCDWIMKVVLSNVFMVKSHGRWRWEDIDHEIWHLIRSADDDPVWLLLNDDGVTTPLHSRSLFTT